MITTEPPFEIPRRWEDIVGNEMLRKTLQGNVNTFRTKLYDGLGPSLLNLLVHGESRSGKTATISLFLRSLVCMAFDEQSGNPCDFECSPCRQRPELGGYLSACTNDQILRIENGGLTVGIDVVDCSRFSNRSQVQDRLQEYAWEGGFTPGFHDFTLVYLDEVDQLARIGAQEILKGCLDGCEGISWIMSTAKPWDISEEIKTRTVRIPTSLPAQHELANWLILRCEQVGISFTLDAISRLTEKCGLVPGTALQAISLATLDPKNGLTEELVNDEWNPS